MEKVREQPWTFREFYDKLLHPSPAFDNRGRHEKCYKDWCAMDEAERHGICKIIEEAQSNGDYVDPNPCFAMNNAMQEYEKRLAKAQTVKKKDPMNYNGSSKYLKEVKKTPLVSAPYKGVFGIYSLAEAIEFHLEIRRAINFNLREYLEQKAINPDYQPPIVNRD